MVATITVRSDVYVVNRALAGCGLNEVISGFTQNKPYAKAATYNYFQNKVKCMSLNEWNFCTGLRLLTLTNEEPEDQNYAFEYQLPGDMIAGGLIGVFDSGDRPNFDYSFSDTTGYVWSNSAGASARYVKDVAEDLMPAWFIEFMASELALIMIPSLKLEAADAAAVKEWNQKAKIEAFMADANETPAPTLQVRSSLISAREV